MKLVADITTVFLGASSGGFVFLLAVGAAVAIAVFLHATREGNRYAVLWGIGSLVLPILFGLIYVARVWWRRGGKQYFRPR
jgi:hypothetical protein